MDTDFKNVKNITIGVGIFVLIILALIFKPFTIIGAGQRGVVTHFGAVTNESLGEGLHFFIPIYTGIQTVNIRTTNSEIVASGASRDLQEVDATVDINWNIDPRYVGQIYDKVGAEDTVYSTLIEPKLNAKIKTATAQYDAADEVNKRQQLSDNIQSDLQSFFSANHIDLTTVNVKNITYSSAYTQAIEDAQVKQKAVQAAQYDADKANIEAQATVNTAKGDAQATVIKAQAAAQANQLQQQTLTDQLLEQQAIKAWDGKLPTTMPSGQTFFNLPITK